jgi:hypothetical protein
MSEKCSFGRTIVFNKVQVARFFDNLRAVFEKHKFPPNRIFRMDESDIVIVPNKLSKVTAEKGKRLVGKFVSADREQLLTVLCCFSGAVMYVPTAIIFTRKRMCHELCSEAAVGTLRVISGTGYMNTDLFMECLQHFENHVKATEIDPVLLVLHNHDSHCNLGAVMSCRDNYITLLNIPPHGSQKIQPLDCGFVGPLKSVYSQECDAFLLSNINQPITQRNVAVIFKRAYLRVATLDKAENSFRACGIYPYKSHVFSPEDFGPAQVSFLPNTEEKTKTDATVILQGDELSPKPSSSTSGAAPSDILASDTSVEPSAS